jgi:hypothetical protein
LIITPFAPLRKFAVELRGRKFLNIRFGCRNTAETRVANQYSFVSGLNYPVKFDVTLEWNDVFFIRSPVSVV